MEMNAQDLQRTRFTFRIGGLMHLSIRITLWVYRAEHSARQQFCIRRAQTREYLSDRQIQAESESLQELESHDRVSRLPLTLWQLESWRRLELFPKTALCL